MNKEMKKILVVSDNHGNMNVLEDLVYIYEEEVDVFLHCGDSEALPTDSIWKTFQTVQGNMDVHGAFPDSYSLSFDGKEIFMTHGHKYQVKSTIDILSETAKDKQADLVLFGHSHVPYCEEKEGRVFINPGSISLPKGPNPEKNYVIIESTDSHIHVHYYNDQHKKVQGFDKGFNLKSK